jgi:hypothetical protein
MKIRRYAAMPLPVLAGITFACAITSPAPGASVTQGSPTTITGTLTGAAVVVQVKLGAVVLGSASIVGLTWSYSWTPQSGDLGAQTLNATATSAGGAQASAAGVAVTVQANSPAGILGSQPAWWLDASAGTLTDAGGGVCSQWADSSTGHTAVNFTFSGAQRPTIISGGLNAKNTLRFSTSQRGGNASFVTPAPGTTPSYFCAIAKEIVIQNPGIICSRGSSGTVSNTYFNGAVMLDANPTPGPMSAANLTANTWHRIEWLESNSASNYCEINGSAGSLGNAGNNTCTGVYLNSNYDGSLGYGNWEFAEIFQWHGVPSAPQRATLAAYFSSKWGV